jgi:hypothetical protein
MSARKSEISAQETETLPFRVWLRSTGKDKGDGPDNIVVVIVNRVPDESWRRKTQFYQVLVDMYIKLQSVYLIPWKRYE